MKIANVLKTTLSGFMSALLLTGFTGQEKYVELNGNMNGRTSAHFISKSANISTLLNKGTRGEILTTKKLPSGNFGVYIKVLNGPYVGQNFWVYHRGANSSLALYETTSWTNSSQRQTSSIEQAKAVETVRETSAYKREGSTPKNKYDDPHATMNLISRASESVQRVGQELCAGCDTTLTGIDRPLLGVGMKPMSKACNSLMNAQGELGPQGQSLYSIMAEPDYARHFTANNSLGGFCPNFNTLSDTEKLKAWTWFWTALAMEESTCNATQEHPTTYVDRSGNVQVLNPVEGYGFWALERDRNIRSWRGEACSRISKPEDQARCAVDIMIQTQLAQGRSASQYSMSYWGPVRRGDKQLMPHMRRLSLCF